MKVPILTRRNERKSAELQAAIEAGVEKALSPAVAQSAQMAAHSGATYPVNPSAPFTQAGGYGCIIRFRVQMEPSLHSLDRERLLFQTL